jgi:uncharacterized membrane protein YkgB
MYSTKFFSFEIDTILHWVIDNNLFLDNTYQNNTIFQFLFQKQKQNKSIFQETYILIESISDQNCRSTSYLDGMCGEH